MRDDDKTQTFAAFGITSTVMSTWHIYLQTPHHSPSTVYLLHNFNHTSIINELQMVALAWCLFWGSETLFWFVALCLCPVSRFLAWRIAWCDRKCIQFCIFSANEQIEPFAHHYKRQTRWMVYIYIWVWKNLNNKLFLLINSN